MKKLKKSVVLKEGYFKGLQAAAEIIQKAIEEDDGLNEKAKLNRDIDQWIYLLIEDGFGSENEGDPDWIRTEDWPHLTGDYTMGGDSSSHHCELEVTRLRYDRQKDVLKIQTGYGIFLFKGFINEWRKSDCEDMVVRTFHDVVLEHPTENGGIEFFTFEYMTIG